MELASMLEAGPFTDHPRSVCPVIGAFLRAYNDWVDDRRRQDLYAYAAKVVGSRAPRGVDEARMRRLLAWADELEERRVKRLPLGPRPRVNRSGPRADDVAGRVMFAIARQKDHPHQEVLGVVDKLLEIGRNRKPPPVWSNDGRPPALPAEVMCLAG
ncbi:MAG TPA: hypothetical protein VJ741_01750 [Solirubrobacteraceae bacterium]|nr:hypothetical protein [Solirubrobacteraceae bacterium]